MILLQTLSRLHVCATLAFAQVIGSICVMAARATAPNRIGPGSVFPDVGTWDFSQGLKGSPMASAPFWIALICQIVIVLGYFWFYRKEQLGEFVLPWRCSIWLIIICFSSTIIMLLLFTAINHAHARTPSLHSRTYLFSWTLSFTRDFFWLLETWVPFELCTQTLSQPKNYLYTLTTVPYTSARCTLNISYRSMFWCHVQSLVVSNTYHLRFH
jgi:hypothetical protein